MSTDDLTDYIFWDDDLEEGYKHDPYSPRMATDGPAGMLNDHTHKRICDLVRAGNYMQTAAMATGVTPQALQRWLMRGTPDTAYWRSLGPWGADEEPAEVPPLMGRYCRFRRDMERAAAEAETMHATLLAKAAQAGEWKASVEWLRRGPAKTRWRDDLHVEANTSGTVQVQHTVDPARLRDLVRGMQEARLLDDDDVIEGEADEVAGELEP